MAINKLITNHPLCPRSADSASRCTREKAATETRKPQRKSGRVLTYQFEVILQAEERENLDIAEESDVLDAVSDAFYNLAEYENAARITTKILAQK